MKKLQLTVEQMNSIIKGMTGICKETSRPITSVIHIVVENEILTATAIDWVKWKKIVFSVKGQSDCQYDIPLMKPFGKKDFSITISDDDNNIIFTTATGTQTIRKIICEPFDITKTMPKNEVKSTIYVNTKQMIETLKSMTLSDTIKIETRGEMEGIMISNESEQIMLLPVNPAKKKIKGSD